MHNTAGCTVVLNDKKCWNWFIYSLYLSSNFKVFGDVNTQLSKGDTRPQHYFTNMELKLGYSDFAVIKITGNHQVSVSSVASAICA